MFAYVQTNRKRKMGKRPFVTEHLQLRCESTPRGSCGSSDLKSQQSGCLARLGHNLHFEFSDSAKCRTQHTHAHNPPGWWERVQPCELHGCIRSPRSAASQRRRQKSTRRQKHPNTSVLQRGHRWGECYWSRLTLGDSEFLQMRINIVHRVPNGS